MEALVPFSVLVPGEKFTKESTPNIVWVKTSHTWAEVVWRGVTSSAPCHPTDLVRRAGSKTNQFGSSGLMPPTGNPPSAAPSGMSPRAAEPRHDTWTAQRNTMNVRSALQLMAPSIELQRSAMDEIARQDAEIDRLLTFVESIAETRDNDDDQAAIMARAWRAKAWDLTHGGQ